MVCGVDSELIPPYI